MTEYADWTGQEDGGWPSGQPPWEAGAPEPDPSLRYRRPGPGMPGYRGAYEQSNDGGFR